MTVAEAAEKYIVWLKQNRTEKYSKRQEHILREDVLPSIGDSPLNQLVMGGDMITSILSLPTGDKRGLAAHNVVLNMIGWKLKHL